MAKKTKAENKIQQENKTPELAAAKKALEKYLKDNKLDPTKDWTKDKKHGKAVTELVNKLNKERDKVAANYPQTDPKNMARIEKKAKKAAIAAETGLKKKAQVEKAKDAKAKKEAKAPRVAKYDYPLVDGREMTAVEKKKYRAEQRRLASGGTAKPKAEPKDKAKTEEPKKTKIKKAAKKEEAPAAPKDKKKKKAKKVED